MTKLVCFDGSRPPSGYARSGEDPEALLLNSTARSLSSSGVEDLVSISVSAGRLSAQRRSDPDCDGATAVCRSGIVRAGAWRRLWPWRLGRSWPSCLGLVPVTVRTARAPVPLATDIFFCKAVPPRQATETKLSVMCPHIHTKPGRLLPALTSPESSALGSGQTEAD